ncbi:MAG: HTH domain-containing protein [Halovenus sp.]
MRATPRVELYLRSLAPTETRGQQEEIVEELQSLEDAGQLAGFEVALCGECVCPESSTADTAVGRRLLRRHEAFEQWADERGRELVGFRERDTESLLTGTKVTGIVFPRMVLAEYREGRLDFVAPSRDGAEQTTVRDRLETYRQRARGDCVETVTDGG